MAAVENQCPERNARGSSREALRATLRNVRDAKDGDLPPAHLLNREAALEVQQAAQVNPRARGLVLLRSAPYIEPRIVVPRDDDLDGVRVGLEPVELSLDIGGGTGIGQVAGVN